MMLEAFGGSPVLNSKVIWGRRFSAFLALALGIPYLGGRTLEAKGQAPWLYTKNEMHDVLKVCFLKL